MTDVAYRRAVARSVRSTVPSSWYLEATEGSEMTTSTRLILSDTEIRAIEIALDALDSYIGVMGEDTKEVQDEAHLEKLQLQWASKRIHTLLESHE
jgi:hypothetical protein